MLSIHIITIHPEFVEAYNRFGVFQAAQKNKLAKVSPINLREFAVDKHGSVDDRPYGGGDGMVLRCEPLVKAVQTLPNPYIISTSPSGKKWSQKDSERFAQFHRPLVFVAGRFSGIDQRFCWSVERGPPSCLWSKGFSRRAMVYAGSLQSILPSV